MSSQSCRRKWLRSWCWARYERWVLGSFILDLTLGCRQHIRTHAGWIQMHSALLVSTNWTKPMWRQFEVVHCLSLCKARQSTAKHYRGEQGVTKRELELCKGWEVGLEHCKGCKGVTRETQLICLYPMVAHNRLRYQGTYRLKLIWFICLKVFIW